MRRVSPVRRRLRKQEGQQASAVGLRRHAQPDELKDRRQDVHVLRERLDHGARQRRGCCCRLRCEAGEAGCRGGFDDQRDVVALIEEPVLIQQPVITELLAVCEHSSCQTFCAIF